MEWIEINWTDEKKQRVLQLIENFIVKYEFTSGEALMQSDDGTIESPSVMADIVDVIEPERIED